MDQPCANSVIKIFKAIINETDSSKLAYLVTPNVILTLSGVRSYCDGIYYSEEMKNLKQWKKEIEECLSLVSKFTEIQYKNVSVGIASIGDSCVSFDVILKRGAVWSIQRSSLLNHGVLEILDTTHSVDDFMKLLDDNLRNDFVDRDIRSHVAFGIALGYPDVAILDYLQDDEQRDPFSAPYIDADIRGAKYYDCPQPIYQYRRTLITNPEIIAHETLWSNILKEYYTSDFHKSLEADPQFQAKLKEIGSLN
jgi:hypothetical protein